MFELEQAISQWRQEIAANGIRSSETLDELESHLGRRIDRAGDRLNNGIFCWKTKPSAHGTRCHFNRLAMVQCFSQAASGFILSLVAGCGRCRQSANERSVAPYSYSVNFRWVSSPREIGAVCASLWLIAFWLVQRFGHVRQRVTMLLCIVGNVIVTLAWFGTGILSRGNGILAYWPLDALLGVHLFFFTMGVVPKFETAEEQAAKHV